LERRVYRDNNLSPSPPHAVENDPLPAKSRQKLVPPVPPVPATFAPIHPIPATSKFTVALMLNSTQFSLSRTIRMYSMRSCSDNVSVAEMSRIISATDGCIGLILQSAKSSVNFLSAVVITLTLSSRYLGDTVYFGSHCQGNSRGYCSFTALFILHVIHIVSLLCVSHCFYRHRATVPDLTFVYPTHDELPCFRSTSPGQMRTLYVDANLYWKKNFPQCLF